MDRNLKTKIAFLYYSCNMTQEEIASRLSLTRQRVNAAIGTLKNEGIVSITTRESEGGVVEKEAKIENHFGITRVIVAPPYNDAKLDFIKTAGCAAEYLEDNISNGDIVGVSFGRMLKAVVGEMRFANKKDSCVVQLLGAQSMDDLGTKSDDIVRSLAEKLNCGTYLMYSPMVVSKKEIKELLIKERPIMASLDAMKRCNIAVFGIGEIAEGAPMHKMGYLSDGDVKGLMADGFVADIALNPIRLDGTYDGCFLSERLLGADVECIKNIENTVGVAAGEEKTDAVIAALRSGLLKTLIIDSALADKIISKLKL